jgi:hypothetical protein
VTVLNTNIRLGYTMVLGAMEDVGFRSSAGTLLVGTKPINVYSTIEEFVSSESD